MQVLPNLSAVLHLDDHRECRVLTETVLQHLPGIPEHGRIRRVTRGDFVYAMDDPTGEVFFPDGGGWL